MRVLSISTDAEILRPESPAAKRMAAYAQQVEALHVIVYTKSRDNGPACVEHSPRLFVYPTRTPQRFAFFRAAYTRAMQVLREGAGAQWVLTTQDPFETGLVGAMIRRAVHIPWQIQVHTDFLNPAFRTSSAQRMRAWMGRVLIARADTIRVVSDRIKQSLIAVAPTLESRITVLPIFVDTEAIAKHPGVVDVHADYPDRFPIILMASRITSEKQISLAITAVTHFATAYPRALLLVVGEGAQKEGLQSFVRNTGAPVVFAPWVDGVFTHYKSADIFLNASAFEGYGRTLVEAHAAGMTIVSTDVGVARDIVATDADGVVVDQSTAASLADGLRRATARIEKGVRPKAMTHHQSFAPYVEKFVACWQATLDAANRE